MPKGLRRFHASGQRHFITCSCYRSQQFLGSARRRDLVVKILEAVRQQYDFVVWGYVVMPETPPSADQRTCEKKCCAGDASAEATGLSQMPQKEERDEPDDTLGNPAGPCFLAAPVLRF